MANNGRKKNVNPALFVREYKLVFKAVISKLGKIMDDVCSHEQTGFLQLINYVANQSVNLVCCTQCTVIDK